VKTSSTTFSGFLLWSGSIAVAYGAQYSLTPLGKAEQGGILYGIAATLAVVGMSMLSRDVSLARAPLSEIRRFSPSAGWAVPIGLLAVGLITNCVSVYLVAASENHTAAFSLWLPSLVVSAAAMVFFDFGGLRLSRFRFGGQELAESGAVLGILALAVALRLPHLAEIPPEVHGDEGACGIAARLILHGGARNLFGLGWSHLPQLGYAISAGFMGLFGDDLFGLRTASVFLGTASVLLVYFLTKRLFSPRIAAVAAFLLAVSHWHIHFSRSGIHYMQGSFATLLLFVLLLRGIDGGRRVDFLLAGFAIGLCFSVYYAARAAPVIAGLYVLHRITTERGFLQRRWQGLAISVLGALLFFAPIGVAYVRHADRFVARAQAVWLFNPRNIRHELYSYHVDRVADVLRIQVINSIEAFNLRGGTGLQYASAAPLIDFWTSALFVLGLAFVTSRAHESRHFLLATWFWLTLLLGSVLTVDALFSPHAVGLIPVLFILAALVIDAGRRGATSCFGRLGTYGFAILTAVLMAFALQTNYQKYFLVYAEESQPAGFHTVLSHYVASINDRYQVYLLGGRNTSLHYDTEHFLIPGVDGVEVRDRAIALPLQRVPKGKGIAFLIEYGAPQAEARLEGIKRAYPTGGERLFKTSRGQPLFYSYVVDHDALVVANPATASRLQDSTEDSSADDAPSNLPTN